MRKKSKYHRFRQWINRTTPGGLILRTEMLKVLEADANPYRRETTCDHYRKTAELAGFLERDSIGVYKLIKKIPETMSYTELLKLAEPNRAKFQLE